MSIISDIFGGGGAPAAPAVIPPPPSPTTIAKAAQQVGQEQTAGFASAANTFGDTLKTGSFGAPNPSKTAGAATLGS